MRRLLIVLAVSTAVVLVGGCSYFSPPSSPPSPPSSGVSGSTGSASPTSTSAAKQGDAPLPDPAALLQEASAATQALQSAHLVMSVVGKVAETPVKELVADLTNENAGAAEGGAPGPTANNNEASPTSKGTEQSTAPENSEPSTAARSNAAAKGKGKVAILGTEIDFQFVVFDGHMYVALPGAAWVDHGPVTRPYSVTAILNPDEGLANVLNNFVDPKVKGREAVGNQHTIRVTGKVTPVAVNKFMPQLGATDRMPASVWIQEGGDRQVVEVSLEPSKGNFVEMVFSDWNEPVTVEKPPDV
jgi:lipoprotein LprG